VPIRAVNHGISHSTDRTYEKMLVYDHERRRGRALLSVSIVFINSSLTLMVLLIYTLISSQALSTYIKFY